MATNRYFIVYNIDRNAKVNPTGRSLFYLFLDLFFLRFDDRKATNGPSTSRSAFSPESRYAISKPLFSDVIFDERHLIA